MAEPLNTGDGPLLPEPVQDGPAIPGYEIVEELGRGGMGVVYRALRDFQNTLGSWAALQRRTRA